MLRSSHPLPHVSMPQSGKNTKNIIISKFKEKSWVEKELEGKSKLKYHKEVIKYNLKIQKLIYFLD